LGTLLVKFWGSHRERKYGGGVLYWLHIPVAETAIPDAENKACQNAYSELPRPIATKPVIGISNKNAANPNCGPKI